MLPSYNGTRTQPFGSSFRDSVVRQAKGPEIPTVASCAAAKTVQHTSPCLLPRPLNDIVFFSIAAEEGIEGTLIWPLKGGLMAALMEVGQSDDQQLDYHNIDCLIPNAELDSY